MPSNDTITDGENDTDIIHSILNGSPFKIRPDDEKLAILEKGRPLYSLNIMKRDLNRDSNVTFHSSFYSTHKWLCGSKKLNKLFCWPCLLMRPESSSWCSIGNDDIKRFTSLTTKHARCKSHLKAVYEYDETLKNFGLTPEFTEYKFKCKEEDEVEEEEEASLSDKTEVDDDLGNVYFQQKEKKEMGDKLKYKLKHSAKESSDNHHNSNIKNKITFKTWQEMYKDNFPVSKSGFYQDFHLYKWKRKIAKQELRNARLIGEKLKFEIEVLRAKIEYHKALKQSAGVSNESSVPDTGSTVSEISEQCHPG